MKEGTKVEYRKATNDYQNKALWIRGEVVRTKGERTLVRLDGGKETWVNSENLRLQKVVA